MKKYLYIDYSWIWHWKRSYAEGVRVLKKVAEKFEINLNFDEFDFSSYDYYKKMVK